MAFGALELLGINPAKLKLTVQDKNETNKGEKFIKRMMVVNENNEEIPLVDYLMDKAQKKLPSGNIHIHSPIVSAAVYDLAEGLSVKQGLGATMLKGFVVFAGIKKKESASSGEEARAVRARKAVEDNYYNAVKQLIFFPDFMSNFQKLSPRKEIRENLLLDKFEASASSSKAIPAELATMWAGIKDNVSPESFSSYLNFEGAFKADNFKHDWIEWFQGVTDKKLLEAGLKQLKASKAFTLADVETNWEKLPPQIREKLLFPKFEAFASSDKLTLTELTTTWDRIKGKISPQNFSSYVGFEDAFKADNFKDDWIKWFQRVTDEKLLEAGLEQLKESEAFTLADVETNWDKLPPQIREKLLLAKFDKFVSSGEPAEFTNTWARVRDKIDPTRLNEHRFSAAAFKVAEFRTYWFEHTKDKDLIRKKLSQLEESNELTLTELVTILDSVKKNVGAISNVGGVELISQQIEKFNRKVEEAFSMPSSTPEEVAAKEQRISTLKKDFSTACDINNETSEIGTRGLMRHLVKASDKLKEFLGKMLELLSKGHRLIHEKRESSLKGVVELCDQFRKVAQGLNTELAVLAQSEHTLAKVLEAPAAMTSVEKPSTEQPERSGELQAALPPELAQTDEAASQISTPKQTTDKPQKVRNLIWKFEGLKHGSYEKLSSPPIKTGVNVSALREKFEPQPTSTKSFDQPDPQKPQRPSSK